MAAEFRFTSSTLRPSNMSQGKAEDAQNRATIHSPMPFVYNIVAPLMRNLCFVFAFDPSLRLSETCF